MSGSAMTKLALFPLFCVSLADFFTLFRGFVIQRFVKCGERSSPWLLQDTNANFCEFVHMTIFCAIARPEELEDEMRLLSICA
jgi:hypothetical protein